MANHLVDIDSTNNYSVKAGNESVPDLMPFAVTPTAQALISVTDNAVSVLPFLLRDYFALMDWTDRALRDGKRGAIPSGGQIQDTSKFAPIQAMH